MGTGFFSVGLSGGSILELVISGFSNPPTVTPTTPFSVSLLTADGSSLDRLEQSSLVVQSKCNYPCKDCSNPSVCTACMTSDMGPLNLLQEGTCVASCRTGLYQFGNLCAYCDPTCLSCDISPLVCTTCNTTSAQPYLFNNQCVPKCKTGYYQNPETYTCDQCQAPCLSCALGTNNCPSCQSGNYLVRGTCRPECPADYFIGNPTTWNCD